MSPLNHTTRNGRPWSARRAAALSSIAERDARKATEMAAAGAAACEGPYRACDCRPGRWPKPRHGECGHCGEAIALNRQAMAGCLLIGLLVGLIVAALVEVVK